MSSDQRYAPTSYGINIISSILNRFTISGTFKSIACYNFIIDLQQSKWRKGAVERLENAEAKYGLKPLLTIPAPVEIHEMLKKNIREHPEWGFNRSVFCNDSSEFSALMAGTGQSVFA